jgi:CRP-like cAMP-binding protein
LASSSLVKRFKNGEIPLAAGERSKHIYFLEQGYARKHHYKDGGAINLDFYLEGSFFTNVLS